MFVTFTRLVVRDRGSIKDREADNDDHAVIQRLHKCNLNGAQNAVSLVVWDRGNGNTAIRESDHDDNAVLHHLYRQGVRDKVQ